MSNGGKSDPQAVRRLVLLTRPRSPRARLIEALIGALAPGVPDDENSDADPLTGMTGMVTPAINKIRAELGLDPVEEPISWVDFGRRVISVFCGKLTDCLNVGEEVADAGNEVGVGLM